MSKELNALLDPRGYQERPVIELSKRPSLEELKTARILFYNNTKLGFCNYYTVFTRIKERLREIGCDDSNWFEYVETVRGKNAEKLGELAHRLVEEYKPDVCIVAFGDMGTSSSTTVLSGFGVNREITGTSTIERIISSAPALIGEARFSGRSAGLCRRRKIWIESWIRWRRRRTR